MTGLVRKATLLAVCGLLSAGIALANVPDPANSECNSPGPATLGPVDNSKAIIYVMGNDGAGTADPSGEFCVTVRDFNNVPIENSSVVLDFSNCDFQLCYNQLDPDVIVDCVSNTVRKLSAADGKACFKVQGKSKLAATLGCSGAPKNCAEVYADGVLICSGDTPTFTLVSQFGPPPGGEEGVNPNDLAEFIEQWLVCGTNSLRCNYETTNQVIDPNDLSYFIEIWLVRAASYDGCNGAKDPNIGPKCP